MREIALFVEDYAHQQIIGALIERLAEAQDVETRLTWRSARRGYGKVVQEFDEYLRDLRNQGGQSPHLIILATDANCKGIRARTKEFDKPEVPAPLVLAIPDPHIERWLLLDGAAFKAVLGRGCDAPDQKCSRDRYKQRLIQEIRAADVVPSLGGIEYAEDIVRNMNIDRACRADLSFKRFVEDLGQVFKKWSLLNKEVR